MNIYQYFEFDGKATRTKYWLTLIGSFIAYLAIAAIGAVMLGVLMAIFNIPLVDSNETSKLIWVPLFLVLMWVWIAVGVKRCRDAGIHPAWLLATLIPALSFVAVIIFGCLPTKQKS